MVLLFVLRGINEDISFLIHTYIHTYIDTYENICLPTEDHVYALKNLPKRKMSTNFTKE